MGKFVVWAWVLVLVVCGTAVAGPSQQPPQPPPDAALEAQFRGEVVAASPEAAAAWDQGNAARVLRPDEAADAYRKVIALAPKLDHPHRRLCAVLALQAKFDDAIRECEVALSLAPASPYDKVSLGQLLVTPGPLQDRARGISLTHEAALALPDDPATQMAECVALSATGNVDAVSRCANHLLQIAPNNPIGLGFAANVAAIHRDFAQARALLDRAKAAGLPPDLASLIEAKVSEVAERPRPLIDLSLREVLEIGIPIVGGWLLALVLLLSLGRRLSQLSLRHTAHLGDADGDGTPRERRLRHTYRIVLWLIGVLFYVSLPLMVILVTAGGLITLAIFDDMGAIPVVVLLVVVIIVITTVTSVIRALLFKPAVKLEGKRVVPSTYPKLQAVLADAAGAIGTRSVDTIYLTPGTDLAVAEHRTLLQAVRAKRSERILILGVALFDNMKQRELRSILAHEYGHFRNADTGGGLALEMRTSLLELLQGLGRSGYAILNPAWWMLRMFTKLYLVVSTGASRLQEALADRWAIRAYGSTAFVTGYRHVVSREVEFAVDLNQTIKDVTENDWSLPNLYAYEPEVKPPAAALAAAIDKKMKKAPGPYDTHPSSSQRIAWAEQLARPGERTHADDDHPVWELFSEPETIEREMTAIMRARIQAKLGVTISDAEWADEP